MLLKFMLLNLFILNLFSLRVKILWFLKHSINLNLTAIFFI